MQNFRFIPGLSGLPCPCCPPRLPLLSSTTPTLPEQKTGSNPDNPVIRSDSDGASDDVTSGLSPFSKANNFIENSGKDFGASVAELRRKAQEHSAAIWQSLHLAQQQQSSATATTLATALSNSGPAMSVNPFLSTDNKEFNFNLLPNVSGLAGLTGLTGFPTHFPPMPNPLAEAGILLSKPSAEKATLPNGNDENGV